MRDIQSVVINLGNGNLSRGFDLVTARVIAENNALLAQFTGSLPEAQEVAETYESWHKTYRALSQRPIMLSRFSEEDDELEIEEGGITQVSQYSFEEISASLTTSFNHWLQSPEFLRLERKLRSHIASSAAIRIIIETNDELVKHLPWHQWHLLQDYPDAEIALSRPEYKYLVSEQCDRTQVRILAILGNSQNIDIEAEERAIAALPDAETKFLIQPSRREFDRQLWDSKGWDILFFAGHSHSEGETGRIYINEEFRNNSLTIEQLEQALKKAIERGLKLAIFNSCDGLGLANAIEKLHIPQVIVMREPVPNLVAQQFFHHFLFAFAVDKLPLYLAVKQARCRLQGLENEYLAASWLPIICQNPAARSPNWFDLGGIPPCPYRGLHAFEEREADWFFGREKFVTDLLERVERQATIAIVGASGSGKTSVVFAGLVPLLRRAKNTAWQIISFRPGHNPLEAMVTACRSTGAIVDEIQIARLRETDIGLSEIVEEILTSTKVARRDRLELDSQYEELDRSVQKLVTPPKTSTSSNKSNRLLLIIDRFEEFFTLSSAIERQVCLRNLITAAKNAPGFTLVITMRADFYSTALAYRPLSDILQGAVCELGAMNQQELHEAIVKPAAQMGVQLESGLTDKLISSVLRQPGSLPLLELTLTKLWAEQKQGWLTHQAYRELGGVESVLANHAEAIYTQLPRSDRVKMSQIFMQLVQLEDETEMATGRLATKEEIGLENWNLVNYLADVRLVTIDRDTATNKETVQIAHQALISSWGRLVRWVKIDENFRRWQQKLRRAIATWENSGGDRGTLWRGKLLNDAKYWQQRRLEDLNSSEREFIFRSIKLEAAERQQEQRRRQLTIWGLIVGLAIATGLSGIAGWQWQNSAINEILATSKYAKLLCASARGFDGLVESLVAAGKIERTFLAAQNSQVRSSTIEALQETVYGVRERNRISAGEGKLLSVDFSPDGQKLATGSSLGKLTIWKDGIQTSIDAHQQQIENVSFNSNGMLATAGVDGTVKLWQANGKLIKTIAAHESTVLGSNFSPDGKMLATAGMDDRIKLWNLKGQLQRSFNGNSGGLLDITYSPDGKMLATAGVDGTVKLWDLNGRLLTTISGYQREVLSVTFSPDGQTIAASSEDGTMKFWSLDGSLLHSMAEENVVHQIRYSPDGRAIISVGGDTTVKLWNSDYSLRQTFIGHTDGVLGLALSPDGQTIATVSADGNLKLWQRDSELFQTLQLHDADVYNAVFSPDNRLIATASGDNTVKLWNRDGTLLNTLSHQAAVHGISFSPDGNLIATASWDKTVKLWTVDGNLINTFTGHSDRVYLANISPDGKTLASASSDGTVKLWQLDGTLITTLKEHKDVVHGLAFSPDGKTIASASHDRTIKLWNLQGKLLKTLTGHNNWVHSVTFSPDGKTIASASHDRTIKLWNLQGKLLKTITGHTDKVLGVAFSHDGKMLASSSRDGSVKLWHPDGTLMATLRGHGDWVHAVNFSPDDLTLASASYDNTAILWNLKDINNLDVLVERGCNWLQNYLQTNSEASDRICK